MLFLEILPDDAVIEEQTSNGNVIEDEIDNILSKLDGKIYRQKNDQL